MGDLFGVDAVVLILTAVDEMQIQCMSQDESQALFLAGVGQPVPAEHAFGADGDVVAVGFDELEELLEVIVLDIAMDQFLALAVHDADVHLARVQVDSAVVFSGGGVIFHTCNTSLLMGAYGHPLIVITAGSVRCTPRPICSDASKKPKGLEWEYQACWRRRRDWRSVLCWTASARRASSRTLGGETMTQATLDISVRRKALLFASAWAAAALAATIIDTKSWGYFWMFAFCSPITWFFSYSGAQVSNPSWVRSLAVIGWLYYAVLVAAGFWSNRRGRTYTIYAVLFISLALNVEGCREWSHASFS